MVADKLIKIDREVYQKLKEIAGGFETPNHVLRRILGMPKSTTKRGMKTGTKLRK